jgi:LAO/AO transport system kinase
LLSDAALSGNRKALAQALRLVDDDPVAGRALVASLATRSRGARIIGITGNPGAGKSTVVDQLLVCLRAQGERVGVLAVDPSSPFSGGAILGDRIRMSRHYADDGVFVRSFATRGALGGLSPSVEDAAVVLDAAGFDTVVIETVGVGQDEVDVVRVAHSTVVVLVPGLGDDIQAVKAGILEIADIFLINKADRAGADDVERALKTMQSLAAEPMPWTPPIARSVATTGDGIEGLARLLERHRAYLSTGPGQERLARQRRQRFERLLHRVLVEKGLTRLGTALETARACAAAGDDVYQLVAALT